MDVAINSTNGKSDQDVPRDAKVTDQILKAMGIEEYEPRVVNQLMEFMHRYVSEILQDAQAFSSHANKQHIEIDDVKLAVQSYVQKPTYSQPPTREVIMELAQLKNTIPLPTIPQKAGVHLPPDEYCTVSTNYVVEPRKKASPQEQPTNAPAPVQENNNITQEVSTGPVKFSIKKEPGKILPTAMDLDDQK